MDNKIGIIGAGNMGNALFSGLIKHHDGDRIHISDGNQEKLNAIICKNKYLDTNEMLKFVDTVVIAVKPQSFDSLMESVGDALKDKLVISIMAGVSLAKLKTKTGSERIVRAMPNIASKHGYGLTGWVKTESVPRSEVFLIRDIFNSVGKSIEVPNEEKIDEITSLSGSGPAYFFYLTDLIKQKAIEFGFSEEDAHTIAEETFIGSAEIFRNGNIHAKELISSVASKGGTTEKALEYLKAAGFDKIFFKALSEAKKRSQELNS